MSQLLLKIKSDLSNNILWVIFLICNILSAQDSIPNLNFEQQCKDSDAYLLYSYTDVSYMKSWSQYKKYTSVSSKLVVNNNSGVDKYAFLSLTEFVANNLEEINVKTLKANGSVVELDSSMVFQTKSKNKRFGAINYPIPGVEPGDTIQTSYTYREYLKNHDLKGYINLYTNVPSLNTEYTVKSNPDLLVTYKAYNNFPKPQAILNDTLTYCVFKMEKIKALIQDENTCLPCELPYVYYSLEKKDSKVRTWKDVYNQEFNFITQPISFDSDKSTYYKRWKNRIIGEAKDSTKYFKFKLLHEDILKNIKMEAAKEEELIKSSGYFLKEKRLNPLSIKRLYRQLLEDLQIEYWAVFARSKRSGPIDPYYIRRGEFDHIFFAYNNEEGKMNLLYPHESYYKYEINEIPTELYNTEAVVVKPHIAGKIKKGDKFIKYDLKLAEVDSVTTSVMILPGTKVDRNYLKQVFYCDLDLKEESPSFKSRFSLSGGLSTELRSFYSHLNQDEEASAFYDALSEFEGDENAFQIDSITETNFVSSKPFNFTLSAKGKLKGALSVINDSIVSINLENLIQHGIIKTELTSSDLNYYLNYGFKDQCLIILDFPAKIDILNSDDYTVDFKSDLGEYYFNLKLKNNQLTLESSYKIIKDMIHKSEYKQLKQMNKLVSGTKNKRLIVKLKKF